MAMAVIMFSFGGLELIGITAAEADDPSHPIPRATNQAIYRILIFYIGALGILLSLYPWKKVVNGGSPFVLIFPALNSNVVATALNIVVLTAALSVYNSCVYANTRMLFGLAKQGNAPRALMKLNRRGVPLAALGVSAFATGICVVVNYFMPGEAFGMLMGLVISAPDHQLGHDQLDPPALPRRQESRRQDAPLSRAWATRSPTTCAWPSWPASRW